MRDDDARHLVAAYRQITVPSVRKREVMLERLLAEGEAVSPGRGRLVASIALALSMAAAVLLLLRGGHAVLVGARTERARADAAMHDAREGAAGATTIGTPPRPVSSPRAEPAVAPAAPALEHPGSVGASEPPASRSPRKPALTTPVEEGERLREEASLIARAQAALVEGDPAGALTLLDQHRESFPTGVMQLERRALRAVALCQAGRRSEGLALAEALLAASPDAPHRQRIASACRQ